MKVSEVYFVRACFVSLLVLSCLCICTAESSVESENDMPKNVTNCADNSTDCSETIDNNYNKTNPILGTWEKITENKEMLQRGFYVLLGVTGIVVVYFVVRAIRVRRRRSRTRRYGLLSGRGDKLELAPLENGDDEDDEEDVTVYEMNGKRLR